MKLKNIKVVAVLVIGFSVVLTGCLKDKDYDNGLIQSVANGTTKVISLASNVQTLDNFTTLAYDNSNNDTVVDYLPVQLTNGNSPASQDIHVTIAEVDTLVDSYNNTNGTDYIVPTAATIVNNVVTIKKGSYQGFLQVKFKGSDLIGQDLAFGFRIASVQESGYTISGNLKDAVVAIVIKNIYDGVYLANGSFANQTNAAVTGPFSNKSVILSTSGATSVDMSGGQPSIGGIVGAYPRLTLDPVTNLVTVTPSPNGPATITGPITPGYVSHYDPAKKTFYIDYGYSSGSRHGTDTLVYQGPQ